MTKKEEVNWVFPSTRKINEQELKAGLEVFAYWNMAKSVILEIKDGFVHYKCYSFRPDVIHADEIKVFLECFGVEKDNTPIQSAPKK